MVLMAVLKMVKSHEEEIKMANDRKQTYTDQLFVSAV